MIRPAALLAIVLLPGAATAQPPRPASACERIASLSLPNTTITLAQAVNAGAFVPPANPSARGGGGSSAFAGTLGPVPDVPGRVTANTAGLGLGYNGGRGIPPFSALPAFCRVAATLKPSPSSDIRMEMWLPFAGWNGHFRGTSPNGLGGLLNYHAMRVGLTDGFAVVITDTGHQA
jgi:feruloyl esterase